MIIFIQHCDALLLLDRFYIYESELRLQQSINQSILLKKKYFCSIYIENEIY